MKNITIDPQMSYVEIVQQLSDKELTECCQSYDTYLNTSTINTDDKLALIWREISKIQYGDNACRVPLALLGSACLLEKLKRNGLM